ncbi:hypothetical protein SEA_CICADA_49 [Microbacterium phage Cicada]|nr:hypothetical protein SEA_CICADA_49 [Microbacterium phage Cicada]
MGAFTIASASHGAPPDPQTTGEGEDFESPPGQEPWMWSNLRRRGQAIGVNSELSRTLWPPCDPTSPYLTTGQRCGCL